MVAVYKLTPERRVSLAAVLDLLIPPDAARGVPGAGEICVDAIEAMLRATPAYQLTIEPGLDWFANRTGSDALAASQTEVPGFVPTLVFLAYSVYYQQPAVVTALGLEARPPHPHGYAMEPSDLNQLLTRVRARGRLYRQV